MSFTLDSINGAVFVDFNIKFGPNVVLALVKYDFIAIMAILGCLDIRIVASEAEYAFKG